MAERRELTKEEAARKAWMSLLAKAPAGRLATLWAALEEEVGFTWLRAPEVGGVMVRGRTGGTGAAFNLGEMTVTRCALKTDSGAVGHAMVQGRDRKKAEIAALVDAGLQGEGAARLRAELLDPLAAEMTAARAARAARADQTKVDFFTMVRGED